MSLDHEAIYKVYSDCVRIDDGTGAFKADGSQISLVQSDIDAARVTLDAESEAIAYQGKRKTEYPSIEDQLDMQYWDKKNGTTTWVDAIAKVKSDNPKP